MKVISIIAFTALIIAGCSKIKRSPGRVYVPDMAYSRAYETYAAHDELATEGIYYNNRPVPGTIYRGEEFPFPLSKDNPGDSVNYVASKQIQNPLPPLNDVQMEEAKRLYLINCGICHGAKLDGNGPLWKNGDGPFPSAPKNLVGDPIVSVMPDGQMFYSITYGKNLMGSYASQLSKKQRWMIVHYIKAQQAAAKATSAPAAADSSATVKK